MKHYSILIIEDDVDVAMNLQLYISSYGHRVDIAINAQEGFQKYLDTTYDILISDIEMPGQSGIELFRKIRQLDPYIVLVLISGHTSERYLLESVTLKLDAYLMKPITSKSINALMKDTLAQKVQTLYRVCPHASMAYSYGSKQLIDHEKKIALSHSEILLIELFLEAPSYILTHGMIHQHVYPDEDEVQNRIKNLIKRMRKKLNPITIVSIPSIGYQLICP